MDLLRRDDKTPSARRNKTSPEQRLARVVEALAVGASDEAIRKFERLAKVYFGR